MGWGLTIGLFVVFGIIPTAVLLLAWWIDNH